MLINVASLSYFIAASAFLVLAVFLATKWRGRLHWIALMVACLCSVAWAASLAYHAQIGLPLSLIPNALEIARGASWIIFLLILLNSQTSSQSSFQALSWSGATHYVRVVLAFLLALFLATIYAYSSAVFPFSGQIRLFTDTFGRVAMAVIGLLLVEQFFRNMSVHARWGVKFVCLGIGGLFVYDFYLYSNAMLFRSINPEIWAARGIVDAISVPLIAVSVARNPKWSLGLLVSRRMLFHSATLVGTACYLLTMAAAGYYLRFFGGSWGTVMQAAFLFGALILLVVLLFSGSVRSWLKVFISKHFYNYNYDYREEWIRFTRTLSADDGDLSERVIRALAELVESPAGALYLNGESGIFELQHHWNMPMGKSAEPANSAFCKLLEKKQWVVDLQDTNDHVYADENIIVPQWLKEYTKAWLVLPLIFNSKLLGFIVLAQARSKIRLNWEILDLLKIAGMQAASYLSQQESANALMVARQFESFNRMSTFMVHDLKNLVAQLSLLLSNAEKHKDNPEFQKDMVDTIDHSVQKMKVLLQKLSRGISADKTETIVLDDLLRLAVESKSPYEPKPKLEIHAKAISVLANRERLERVIGHLIQNAIEATPRNGDVSVHLSKENNFAVVEIKDTGVGMSEEFIRDKLFTPFVSTKVAGMGIGVFETKEYIAELGGILEVSSRVSQGSSFKIRLPYQVCADIPIAVPALNEQIQKVVS